MRALRGGRLPPVVAEDRYTAGRVRDLIEVIYEELAAVTDSERALRPGSPLAEDSWSDNVMMNKEFVCGGKEAASFLMDRVMDRVADATGIDRVEVRLRNFIQSEEFPYSQVSGAMLDSGDYPKAMRRVMELIDVEGFRKEQAEARRQGRYLVMKQVSLRSSRIPSEYRSTT